MSHAVSSSKFGKGRSIQLLALMGFIKEKTMEIFNLWVSLSTLMLPLPQCFCQASADVTYFAAHKGKAGFVVISTISWSVVSYREPSSCSTEFNCFRHFSTSHKADYRVLVYKHCSCLHCLTWVCCFVSDFIPKIMNFYVMSHNHN